MKMSHVFILASLATTVFSTPSFAIDVDAGDYTALPAGTNLALLYYQGATRNSIYSNGAKATGNNRLDSNVGILRGVHFTEIGGYTVDPQFLLPFGKLTAKNDLASALGEESGIGDLILASTVWLINDPKKSTYFGITPFLFAPTGSYDKNKVLNLGENRWKFTLQGGLITSLTDKLLLDVIGDVTFFGKNDEYLGNNTLKQRNQYQFQTYLRYQINPTWDVRVGASYIVGGETELNGVSRNDKTRTTKFSLGSGYFVAPDIQLLGSYGRDASVENGFKENNRLNLRILKVF